MAAMQPKYIDLYDESLAFSGCPDPNKNAVRTSAAFAIASVTFSSASHKVPRIPQAATSAGPRELLKDVRSVSLHVPEMLT